MAALATFQREYVQDFPKKLPQAMIRGFLMTTVISLIFSATISGALATGSVAAIATLIEAITRPIILQLFVPQDYLQDYEPVRAFFAVGILVLSTIGLNRSISPYVNVGYDSILRNLSSFISVFLGNPNADRRDEIGRIRNDHAITVTLPPFA